MLWINHVMFSKRFIPDGNMKLDINSKAKKKMEINWILWESLPDFLLYGKSNKANEKENIEKSSFYPFPFLYLSIKYRTLKYKNNNVAKKINSYQQS